LAAEGLKALVRRLSPWPEVHLALWAGSVGLPGQTWVEEDKNGLWLVRVLRSPLGEKGEFSGRLIRAANDEDLRGYKETLTLAEELRIKAQERAKALGFPLRFRAAELDLRRSFLRLYFTAQGRVDFRQFIRNFSAEAQVRVELRQLGPRDETRILGLLGPCGRLLCCRAFLTQLRPIPLEFAFEQQLFLNPERLTGSCGRLKCCLAYERDFYLQELQGLPEPGQRVEIDGRTGKILAHNIFSRTTQVEWSDGTRSDVPWEELLT
jgi:cell fate regulator YaaT (PSP1 superfamily)